MLSDEPAAIAICFVPFAVAIPSTIRGGKRECISRGALSSLIFQISFRSLTFAGVRIFSSFCQPFRLGLPPSVGHSAAWATQARNNANRQNFEAIPTRSSAPPKAECCPAGEILYRFNRYLYTTAESSLLSNIANSRTSTCNNKLRPEDHEHPPRNSNDVGRQTKTGISNSGVNWQMGGCIG